MSSMRAPNGKSTRGRLDGSSVVRRDERRQTWEEHKVKSQRETVGHAVGHA